MVIYDLTPMEHTRRRNEVVRDRSGSPIDTQRNTFNISTNTKYYLNKEQWR